MNLRKPEIVGRLPETVRRALIAASQVGAPDSQERRCAIDGAIREARLRHPQFFGEEGVYANRVE